MSWSVTAVGKKDEALNALQAGFDLSARGQESHAPLFKQLVSAVRTALEPVPPENKRFVIESSGHIDSYNAYFSLNVKQIHQSDGEE